MKTLSVELLILLIWAQCSWTKACAQASYALINHWRPVGLDAPVFRWDGVPLEGSEWRVELYGGGTQDSLHPVINVLYGTREIVSLAAPGYFRSSSGFLSVVDVPAGGWAWLQVNVWDIGLGASFEDAAARGMGGYGQSALFYAQGGCPTGLPTPPGFLIGLQSFSVLPFVPEPSVGWLLAGGFTGLWLANRRRPCR